MREFSRVQPNPKKKSSGSAAAKGGCSEETAGKKSPQKEYKKFRMKGEEEDEDGRPPNVTGSITFTPSAPSPLLRLFKSAERKEKERKTMAFPPSTNFNRRFRVRTLVLAILFDQIGKRRRRNRLKNDQKKKVKDCGAFVEIVDIPCPPPPEKHVVRKVSPTKFVLKDIFEVSGRKDRTIKYRAGSGRQSGKSL